MASEIDTHKVRDSTQISVLFVHRFSLHFSRDAAIVPAIIKMVVAARRGAAAA